MHLITSWPFVSVQARPVTLFDLLSTPLVYSDPHNKCVNAPSFSLSAVTVCCVQLVDDSTVLKEKVAHCHLKGLGLYGARNLLPLLSGAKENCSITDLYVHSEPITTFLHVTILYHVRAL